ncbi:MAG: hypothetical protein DRP09_18665 [Candidatus Thorarchaeota archaeon]|nr:MAG: hypothetical protein DRP09_18665 [Candidatus Thorarchaeota archaeon]
MCELESPVIRKSSFREIETHLIGLGGGNQEDNLRSISSLPNYYLMMLSEDEFLNLVFLQNDGVIAIAPHGEDRRLRAVASRALRLYESGETELSDNWNLESTFKRLKEHNPEQRGFELPALVLRDARGSEREYDGARWYIQDGCHRALAYAMTVIRGDVTYQPQRAFCATASISAACPGR